MAVSESLLLLVSEALPEVYHVEVFRHKTSFLYSKFLLQSKCGFFLFVFFWVFVNAFFCCFLCQVTFFCFFLGDLVLMVFIVSLHYLSIIVLPILFVIVYASKYLSRAIEIYDPL